MSAAQCGAGHTQEHEMLDFTIEMLDAMIAAEKAGVNIDEAGQEAYQSGRKLRSALTFHGGVQDVESKELPEGISAKYPETLEPALTVMYRAGLSGYVIGGSDPDDY